MKIRISIAQLNAIVGDIQGNKKKIMEYINLAEERQSDIIVFPELFLTGYPPEDLILKLSFLKDNMKAMYEIVEFTKNKEVISIFGFIYIDEDAYNAAAIVKNGKLLGVYKKMMLPNYSVFDEKRYFAPGKKPLIMYLGNTRVGVTICEDLWNPTGPVSELSMYGSELVVNLSASPYYIGKEEFRRKYFFSRAYDNHVAIVYTNLVGGQDELVFDGSSLVFDAEGNLITELDSFEEEFETVDIDVQETLRANLHDPRKREVRIGKVEIDEIYAGDIRKKQGIYKGKKAKRLPWEEIVLRALKTGVRDYVRKNGFEKVVIGLSGGIDSSLVAAIAVEALGKENVLGILMPSMYTSKESLEDAENLAKNLEIKTYTIPITQVYHSYINALNEVFSGASPDVTEENIQARIRGNYLMAISNKFGYLVLTTGNKSEMATGYATLYGDMAGGFAVIKDLYKTQVYKIAQWINEKNGKEIIPQRVFEKPPSAELRPGQTDQDKLPPYELLDKILKLYIEKEMSVNEIVEKGFDLDTVKYVAKLVDVNEYKRRQAPPGVKISQRAFGKDRRMPITNKYRAR